MVAKLSADGHTVVTIQHGAYGHTAFKSYVFALQLCLHFNQERQLYQKYIAPQHESLGKAYI